MLNVFLKFTFKKFLFSELKCKFVKFYVNLYKHLHPQLSMFSRKNSLCISICKIQFFIVCHGNTNFCHPSGCWYLIPYLKSNITKLFSKKSFGVTKLVDTNPFFSIMHVVKWIVNSKIYFYQYRYMRHEKEILIIIIK